MIASGLWRENSETMLSLPLLVKIEYNASTCSKLATEDPLNKMKNIK